MPIPTNPSNPSVVDDTTPSSPTQHSRSSSMQSTATTTTTTDYDEAKIPVPTIVQRDMEFFMARLTRTTSHDSTGSR